MTTHSTIATLFLPDEVTFENAPQCSQILQKQLLTACDTGAVDEVVTIDASAVKKFDSSALAVLLQCRRDAYNKKRTIAIKGMPKKLRELSHLYGVDQLIPDAA